MKSNKSEEVKDFSKVKESWDDKDLPAYDPENQKNGMDYYI